MKKIKDKITCLGDNMKKQVNRMCFICRQTFDKKELNRIVKNAENQIFLDKTGKANGRGAYICCSNDCISKLAKPKVLNRAFKCELSEEVYKNICEELLGNKN